MNEAKRNDYGFTLIEIIFALAIFGILTLAIYTMTSTIINVYNNSEKQYNATLLAQRYFESIKASPKVDIGNVLYEEGEFIITVDISEVSKYNGKLYKIIVEVELEEHKLERIEGFKVKT